MVGNGMCPRTDETKPDDQDTEYPSHVTPPVTNPHRPTRVVHDLGNDFGATAKRDQKSNCALNLTKRASRISVGRRNAA